MREEIALDRARRVLNDLASVLDGKSTVAEKGLNLARALEQIASQVRVATANAQIREIMAPFKPFVIGVWRKADVLSEAGVHPDHLYEGAEREFDNDEPIGEWLTEAREAFASERFWRQQLIRPQDDLPDPDKLIHLIHLISDVTEQEVEDDGESWAVIDPVLGMETQPELMDYPGLVARGVNTEHLGELVAQHPFLMDELPGLLAKGELSAGAMDCFSKLLSTEIVIHKWDPEQRERLTAYLVRGLASSGSDGTRLSGRSKGPRMG